MKRRILFLLVLAMIVSAAFFGHPNYQPSSAAWTASAALMNQQYYGFGYDLSTGDPIASAKLFRTIVDSPKSHLVFRRMYDEGGAVAKAYAIAGLHQSALGRLDSRIDNFREEDCSIPVVFHGQYSPEQVLSELGHESFQKNF